MLARRSPADRLPPAIPCFCRLCRIASGKYVIRIFFGHCRTLFLALALAVTTALSGATASFATERGGSSVDPEQIKADLPQRLSLGHPVTITLQPEPTGTAVATDTEACSSVLTVQFGDINLAPGDRVEVRVFLNKPDATAETPPAGPHFVGALGFFPLAGGAGGLPLPFSLSMRRPVEALSAKTAGACAADGSLTATFVLVPLPGAETSRDVSLGIASASVGW